MERFRKICLVLLILALLETGDAFLTNMSPVLGGQLLPRVGALDERSRNNLREVLNVESSYGECRETILRCLAKEPPDKTSVRIANFCAYLLSKGVPPHDLWILVKERAKFANEEKPYFFTYSDAPVLGNPKAEITITEFAEFKCHHCVALSPVLKHLVDESGGTVRVLFKHFPLKSHQGSVMVSAAAQAAHRQGRFWEMYDLLFKDFNRQSSQDLLHYARSLGLEVQRFKADMEDPNLVAIIERDKMEGVRAQVRGTPTLFINGKRYDLLHDEGILKDVINEEAERMAMPPPYKEWVYDVSK